MPIRITRKLTRTKGLSFSVPTALRDSFGLYSGDRIVAILNRHYGPDGSIIQEMDEPCVFDWDNIYSIVLLRAHPIVQKYGLDAGEGIELLITQVDRDAPGANTNQERIRIDVFPARVLEDMKFAPDKQEGDS